MDTIPENNVTAADLEQWYKLKSELGRIKSAEALLRSKIFKHFFPVPEEGTNTVPLNDGTGAVIKAQHKIDRTIDQGTLDALRTAQTEALAKIDEPGFTPNIPIFNIDVLVKWKPELVLSKYRELTAEQRHYFDQALVIKPGSPQVEITIPKRPSVA